MQRLLTMTTQTDVQLQELNQRLQTVESWLSDSGNAPPQYTFPITITSLQNRVGLIESVANDVVTNALVPQLRALQIDADTLRTRLDQILVPAVERHEIRTTTLEQMNAVLLAQLNAFPPLIENALEAKLATTTATVNALAAEVINIKESVKNTTPGTTTDERKPDYRNITDHKIIISQQKI